jgi:hypothetical protein
MANSHIALEVASGPGNLALETASGPGAILLEVGSNVNAPSDEDFWTMPPTIPLSNDFMVTRF